VTGSDQLEQRATMSAYGVSATCANKKVDERVSRGVADGW